jgi:hypothetical protein
MSSFDHKNGRLGFFPQVGAPTIRILQPFQFLSVLKVSFDPGGKGKYGNQFSQLPYAVLTGSAEPKLEIELSDASEAWDARIWAGGIGAKPLDFSHVFSRLGIGVPQNFLFTGACWVNGGGYDSDEGNGVTSKISVMCKDVLQNGVSIYV